MAYWILYHMISARGTSRHAWDVPASVVTVSYIKLQASIQIVIAPAIWAAKSAILALYIRLFGTVRWLKITCYVWIGLMALFYGSNIVVSVVYCIPRKGEAWDGTSFARCGTSAWSAVVIGVFSTVADVVIFVLPFPILLKLRVNPTKKLGLILLFLTGFILVILSVLSLVFRTMIFRGTDVTWYGTSTGILTFAELFGTIIVSCAPALSAFWFKILTQSSLWSSLVSSRKTQDSDAVLPTNLHFNFVSTSILKDEPKASSDDASAKSRTNSGRSRKNEKPMPYMAPWKDDASAESADRETEKTKDGPLVSVRSSDVV
jgi:hypothetical protein